MAPPSSPSAWGRGLLSCSSHSTRVSAATATLLPMGSPFQKRDLEAGWPAPSLLFFPGDSALWEQAAPAHHMGNAPQLEKAAGQLSGGK